MKSPTNGSRRYLVLSTVTSVTEVADNIFVLRFFSREVASTIRPGQFINVKVMPGYSPLLRRPFSVYRVVGDEVEIIFNAVGQGTRILSKKRAGEELDVLGPLGKWYGVDTEFDTALLVAGGLGVAPMPIVTEAVNAKKKRVVTFLGARTGSQAVLSHLDNIHLATDDGSKGFHGTVVDLLRHRFDKENFSKPKIFACGPNAMLKHVARFAEGHNIPCEVSLECSMACGFGICQGCPVEKRHELSFANSDRKKYYLVCKDGPVFSSNDIVIE